MKGFVTVAPQREEMEMGQGEARGSVKAVETLSTEAR